MKFQMSLPIEPTFTLSPDGNSMSPLKLWLHHPPQKRTPTKCTISWQHFEHLRASTVAGRYKQEALHKSLSGWPSGDGN
jgi:hypothetical protein